MMAVTLAERRVRIELRQILFGPQLSSSGLLHLRPVGRPERLGPGVQALEDGQRLLRRPMRWQQRRRDARRCHGLALRGAAGLPVGSLTRAPNRSSASLAR